MPINAAPWIERAAHVGGKSLAVLIARRLVRHEQVLKIPLIAIYATHSPIIVRSMLRRMQAAGLLAYRIRSQWIEIAAWTADVF